MPTPYEVVLPHYAKCFPEYLRAAGYYCTNDDKTDYQFDPPFTAWDECEPGAHWRNRGPGQPFFAVFNPMRTHESGMWESDRPLATDPDSVEVPPFLPDTPNVRRSIARQYDNIAESDRELGRRLAELEEDGLLENTIVMIWSDHGEGLPRAKRWLYDSGMRIPLIVRLPGGERAGERSGGVVSLLDLAPTVLSLCGVPLPVHLQGHPFTGPAAQRREYAFGSCDRLDESYDMIRSVRDERFKYIRNYRTDCAYQLWLPYSFRHAAQADSWRLHLEGRLDAADRRMLAPIRPPEELYDVAADPDEIDNLAADPACANELTRLRGVLDDWRQRFDRFGEIDETAMVGGWYPGGVQPRTAAPIFVPLAPARLSAEPSTGARIGGPIEFMLHSATQGASIGWRAEGDSAWRLYTGPIRIERGERLALRAKAIRIGYRESDEASAEFEAAP